MAERAATIEGIESIAVSMTERVIAEVIAHLSSKIDRAIADMEGRIEDRHAVQDARIADLASTVRVAAATVTEMVAGLSPSLSPPPRPAVIDAACKAAADDGTRRIQVNVYGRTVVHYVQPGDDPEQLWADMCAAVVLHSETATWED